MPELPEVEALAGYLRERAVGHVVARVEVAAINALKTYDPPPSAVAGRTIVDAGRHGKFLDLTIDGGAAGADSTASAAGANSGTAGAGPGTAGAGPGTAEAGPGAAGAGPGAAGAGSSASSASSVGGAPSSARGPALHLVVHLARAGWLHYRESFGGNTPLKPGKGPIALRVRLDDGSGFDLTEAGTQKKLAAYLVTDPGQVPGVAKLGPDALAADEASFAAQIRGRRGQLKGVLTDQSVLAGVGNAYSDEILHTAQLSPFAISDRLSPEQMARLHAAVRQVLTDAVVRSAGQRAATLKAEKRSGLRVHARTGLPCPVCGDTIREVSFADSSLQYCPGCQTGGKPLADRRLSKLIR